MCDLEASAVTYNFASKADLMFQEDDTFNMFDTDSWSGLTWLTMMMMGVAVSGVMLAWSCVGKTITEGGAERKYRVKM